MPPISLRSICMQRSEKKPMKMSRGRLFFSFPGDEIAVVVSDSMTGYVIRRTSNSLRGTKKPLTSKIYLKFDCSAAVLQSFSLLPSLFLPPFTGLTWRTRALFNAFTSRMSKSSVKLAEKLLQIKQSLRNNCS